MTTGEQAAWRGKLHAVQEKLDRTSQRLMDERDTVIVQCWRSGALSYAGIADATGLSKSRVIQIVRANRGRDL